MEGALKNFFQKFFRKVPESPFVEQYKNAYTVHKPGHIKLKDGKWIPLKNVKYIVIND